MHSVLDLAKRLIQMDTCNPPGNERRSAQLLADVLRAAGFEIRFHHLDEARASIVAFKPGTLGGPALAFTGHLDTVPIGDEPWSVPPFGAEEKDGRLYGRGASDMKAAVAAFVVAAINSVEVSEPHRDILIVITAGEERGCEGVRAMLDTGFTIPPVGGWVVTEPTANKVALGHKGALFAYMQFAGKSAHSSRPELGDNAIYKACRAALNLEILGFDDRHAHLGAATVNVGLIEGGHAANAVPSSARLHVDVRTLPGMVHGAVLEKLVLTCGGDAVPDVIYDLPPVWTPESHEFVALCRQACEQEGVDPGASHGATFFTDAALLTRISPAPVVILGPGQPEQAHVKDEWCGVSDIIDSVRIYSRLIRTYLS